MLWNPQISNTKEIKRLVLKRKYPNTGGKRDIERSSVNLVFVDKDVIVSLMQL